MCIDADSIVHNIYASDSCDQPVLYCLALGGGWIQTHLKGTINNHFLSLKTY